MIPDAVWVAFVIAVSTTTGPLLLSYLTNRNHKAERREDWARQDIVASKAREVALQLKTNTIQTNEKLDTIHILVNSNMTAAMQGELASSQRELVLMKEITRAYEAGGLTLTPITLLALKTTEARIAELTAALSDRLQIHS